MYISNINIKNFRNFKDSNVKFKEGINLLIGSNNSGKSNLLRCLRIIFDEKYSKQLTCSDFNNDIPLEILKEHSPSISITVTLTQSETEDLTSDELVTVSTWLTELKEPYIAKIQYNFFLPEKQERLYKDAIIHAKTSEEVFKIIEDSFIRFYIHKFWIGNPENQIPVDYENLSKFDFQFLDAIRDVERDMNTGKNTLLKNVIDFFIDYDIKSDQTLEKDKKEELLKQKHIDFNSYATIMIDNLQKRLNAGKKEILSYADKMGASFDNNKPDLIGTLTESDLYNVLKLIIKQDTNKNIPISNNGLGYNNLTFISLLLAEMQVNSDGKYNGENTKVFPILAIEEPEAHLHPTMQLQFLKFLKSNLEDKKVRQVFITSHSTHITSSANIDDIICFYKNNNITKIAYPGRVFYNKNINSKKYVQRFLDATKSNMLFSEKIILVEGLAEQVLLPIFAEWLGYSLEDNHISVISIGGRYFNHFLYMFDENNENSIHRRIACITDLDPCRKEQKKGNYSSCYPFEYDLDKDIYEYSKNPFLQKNHSKNIHFFTQSGTYGKTLEYQIAFDNPTCKLLLTDSLSNKDKLGNLMDNFDTIIFDEKLEKNLGNIKEKERILEGLKKQTWNINIKRKSLIASIYLNSVSKGENSLELACKLEEKIENHEDKTCFNVPDYIKEVFDWLKSEEDN